jgi:DUF1365 family protein
MYAYLDLDEIETVFDGRWLWSTRRAAPIRFRREDYLGSPTTPLKAAVLEQVEHHLGRRPTGPVRLLTHLRHFGYCFNPVSFYYVYDAGKLDCILAQITNTPWGERHTYALDVRAASRTGSVWRFQFGKTFHVSPFLPMDLDYDWRFDEPADRLHVHMADWDGDSAVFEASLSLKRSEISSGNLCRALLNFPFMTFKVLFLIHWQALRLLLKRVPFYTHPGSRA